MLIAKELTKSFTKEKIVKKRFGKAKHKLEFKAVDQVSLNVATGEILGVLGPNGAGKTTLLRMLGGIMESEGGVITIDGMNYNSDKDIIKSKIAYLSNNTKLYGRFSANELLLNLGQIYGLNIEKINEKIKEIDDKLHIGEFLNQKIETLSTGQSQRINIARCLLHDPKLYILDEPTLGLDVISSKSIVDFMMSEKEKGKSVIYSTHYMEEAEYLCDRIILIHKGKILVEGYVSELKSEYNVKSIRELFFKLADTQEGDDEN